eukprot:CAMPEP_0195509004 /NCGR_PEP_ID=MMETSP0794_2-20130614/2060_1 /TAXON_ID=515487 /ORGANISM="Stephanopyxis turris, Strain CCMP 815" /LENGTH=699 /DNA_ID=CAMNT_0040636113 /DNA_START=114 /DNA_END=2210 /DNA_ORIENTATION=-
MGSRNPADPSDIDLGGPAASDANELDKTTSNATNPGDSNPGKTVTDTAENLPQEPEEGGEMEDSEQEEVDDEAKDPVDPIREKFLYEGDPDIGYVTEYHHPEKEKDKAATDEDVKLNERKNNEGLHKKDAEDIKGTTITDATKIADKSPEGIKTEEGLSTAINNSAGNSDKKSKKEAKTVEAVNTGNTATTINGTSIDSNMTSPTVSPTTKPFESVALNLPENTACIVEFYAPWCPHCQRYKPHYIELASDIMKRSYGDVPIAFFAVSCTVYQEICASYEVDGYPTILGFPISKNATKKHEEPIWLQDLENGFNAESIGDAMGFGIARVSKSLRSEDYASERKIYSNSTDQREYDEERDTFLKWAGEQAEQVTAEKLYVLEFPNRTIHDVYNDAAQSFSFLLKQGIYNRNGPLSKERATVFMDWIDLLHWCMPPDWGMMSLIDEIRNDFDYVLKSKANLLNVVERHDSRYWRFVGGRHGDENGDYGVMEAPPVQTKSTSVLGDWSEACTQSNTGYTCGLWELFHIMSVGVSMRYMEGFRSGEVVGPHFAAQTLRNFVERFFGCAICRANFLRMFDSCGFHLCSRLTRDLPTEDQAKQFPLWLWETHNAVNKRLTRENAELEKRVVTDDETNASVFPTKNMCPKCWREDGSWDELEVYSYLRNYYWPGGKNVHPKIIPSVKGRQMVHLDEHFANQNGPTW